MRGKNTQAVSPIIATILLVSITVVLAAVLYVMLIGFHTDSPHTPAGAFTKSEKIDSSKHKLVLSSFSPESEWQAFKIIIENKTDKNISSAVTFSLSYKDGIVSGTPLESTCFSISGVDVMKDSKISGGDYFIISGLPYSAESYIFTVSIIYIPNGSLVDDITFTR